MGFCLHQRMTPGKQMDLRRLELEAAVAQCKAKTQSGERCRNNAIPGMKYCYIRSHGDIRKPLIARMVNLVQNHWLTAIAAAGVAVVGLALGVWTLVRDVQKERREAISGVLTPMQLNTLPDFVAVGGVLFRVNTPDGVLLRDGGSPLISMRISENKMLVSAIVTDDNGDVVAEIHDNEWSHQKAPLVYDRNYTDSVLEVRDGKGKVALQVVDFGDVVHVAGIFHCSKDKWTFVLGPAKDGGAIIEARPPGTTITYSIPPICDYPSGLHFGSCPGSATLRRSMQGKLAYDVQTRLEVCRSDAAQRTQPRH
jgi:hypothetical protein